MKQQQKSDDESPVVANAYAVVAANDAAVLPVISAAAVELDQPNRPQYYHHSSSSPDGVMIPEAAGLSWTDDFFDDNDDDGIIAVFDLDYASLEGYYSSVGWTAYLATLCCGNIFWLGCLAGVPCYLNSNVSWSVRSQHVAITRDGVRFVRERRKTFWGCPCTDAGRVTKTIPFDQITNCEIVEPGGDCLCIENRLSTVNVDTTASSRQRQKRKKGQARTHELVITGLKEPEAFKRLLLAMKRRTAAASSSAVPAALDMLGRGEIVVGNGGGDNDDVADLLRDIRDELRQHNQVLQQQQQASGDASVSANVASAATPPPAPSAPSDSDLV